MINEDQTKGMNIRINKKGDILIKIVYWGCAASGKTTAVDTLFKLISEGDFNIKIIQS